MRFKILTILKRNTGHMKYQLLLEFLINFLLLPIHKKRPIGRTVLFQIHLFEF